jgi:glycosyltransferase involved in cell wall biosynthesis
MHVLHVISSLDARDGGPPAALAGLASAQQAAGLTVTVLATWRRGDAFGLAETLREAGVTVRPVGPAWGPLNMARGLKAEVHEAVASADVLHIHALWEQIQWLAAEQARAQARPYVLCPCGMLGEWSLAHGARKKRLYRRLRLDRMVDGAAAVHVATTMEASAVGPATGDRPVIVEPLGVRSNELETLPTAGRFRARHAVGDRPLVAYLGRIHPGKGVDRLTRAFGEAVTATGIDARLAIAGPDSANHRRAVERLAQRWGMAERVIFTGPLHGRERFAPLRDADLFVLHSDHENFGLSAVEAMATGTPVLVSDRVAIHEAITNAGAGEALALETSALTEALGRWLNRPARRSEAGRRGRELVRERFVWPRIADRWWGHYAELTGMSPAPRVEQRDEAYAD